MSLDASLRYALSGLTATQRGLDVVSRNIANADTQGYTRKTLTQYNDVLNGTGVGVRLGNIERELDQALQREVLSREGDVAYGEVLEKYLRKIDAVQGKPDSEQSLGSLVTKLRDSFARLLDQPDQATLQNDVIESADTMARMLNDVSRTVTDLRNQAQAEIADMMSQLNLQLQKVDDLNRQLSQRMLVGQTAPDLEDQRDQALQEISKLVDITYFRTGDGSVRINAANGQPLLDASYQPLSTEPSQLTPNSYYETGNPASPIAPILMGGTTDMTPYLKGGKLGGLLELRDGILPGMQAELDELAVTMAKRFEDAGLTLFTDNGGGVPTGWVAPPAALDYVGFAAEIQVSDAIRAAPEILRDGDAGQPAGASYPGYRDQIQTVVDDVFGQPASAALYFARTDLGPGPRTLSTRLPASATLATYSAELVTAVGVLHSNTTSAKQAAQSVRDQFQQLLTNESGVNVDQEIGVLIQLQRSYSSCARIVTTNQEMFQELMRAVG
jgi:flagellar hook-associated protein 1